MRSVSEPWTQSLSVRWRPALQFYEERIPILQEYERQGVLHSFAVEAERIGARLLEAGHQLSVHQDALTVSLFGPNADHDGVWTLVMMAVNRLRLTRTRDAQARFQHFVPLEMSFEEAVAGGVERVVRIPGGPDAAASDFAVVGDIAAPDGVTGQLEFGIIRSGEVGGRLLGRVGRSGPTAWEEEQLKLLEAELGDVALFVDSRWRQDAAHENANFEEVERFWVSTKSRAGSIVDELYETICNSRGVGGYIERRA